MSVTRIDQMLMGTLNRMRNEKEMEIRRLTEALPRARQIIADREAEVSDLIAKQTLAEADLAEIDTRLTALAGRRRPGE